MEKVLIITEENYLQHNPAASQWKQRVVKVTLFHLDNTTSEIKLTLPIFSHWIDCTEMAERYLSGYVNQLTQHYLKISAFQVQIGSINDKGAEVYGITYDKEIIPLNKVYVPNYKPFGRWVKPETEKRRQQGSRLKQMVKDMGKGRHPVSGQSIKHTKDHPAGWQN